MTDPQQDYTSRVYSALKDNLSGFDKTPAQFMDSMQDANYRSKVYSALKDNVQGFDKTPEAFDSLTIGQKKNPLPTSSPVSSPSSDQSGSEVQSTQPVQQTQQTQPTQTKQAQPFDPATFMRQSRANVLSNQPQDNLSAQVSAPKQIAQKKVQSIQQNTANSVKAKPVVKQAEIKTDDQPFDLNKSIQTDFPNTDPNEILGNKDLLSGYYQQKNSLLQNQINQMEASEKRGVMQGAIAKLKTEQQALTDQVYHYNSIHAGLEGGGDPVKTGIILGKSMGDPQAAQQERYMAKGIAVNPIQQLNTESAGLDAQETTLNAQYDNDPQNPDYRAALANIQNQKATILQRHPEALRQLWSDKIGEYIAKHLSPLEINTGVYGKSLPEYIADMKKEGMNVPDNVVKNISWPDNLPKSIASKFATGLIEPFSNAAASIERMGGNALGVDKDILDKDISQGQANLQNTYNLENPASEELAGKVLPSSSITAGNVAKGLGGLLSFVLTANNVGKGAENMLSKLAPGMADDASAALAQHIGTDATVFATSYEPNYQKMQQIIGDDPKDEGKRNIGALLGSFTDAAVFHLPIGKYGEQLTEGKTAIANVLKDLPANLKGLSSETLNTNLKKYLQKPLANILEAAGNTSKEAGKFGAIQSAGVLLKHISQSVIANNNESDKDWENVPAEIADQWKTLPISLMPGIFGINLLGAGKESSFRKQSRYDAFANPQRSLSDLGKAKEAGLITPQEYNQRAEVINVGTKILNETPNTNPTTGLPLTHDQAVTWVNNRLKEYALSAKKEGVKDDKVLSKFYDGKIKELQAQREQILQPEIKKEIKPEVKPAEEAVESPAVPEKAAEPAEPVSSPVISDLTNSDVIMNGERGKLKTDEENNVLFDNGTKETLLGKTTDEKFNNSNASEYGIKPAQKVEVKGDNVNIDGEDFTLKPNGESFNKDNNGNLASVTLINKDGEERTMRNKDVALDVAIAKNQHDFESKPEPKDYTPAQQTVKDSFTEEHGQKADDIINSMPEEVADTFAAMDNKIEALAPEETQQMVIRASEWADKAREDIKNGNSTAKEKADAIKMLDKFDKDLNKYYGKLEKQRKGQANADVKREQVKNLAEAKQRSKSAREKAKQLEIEAVDKENLANSLESRNRTYKLVNEIDEPTDARGIALQYFAGGNKVDSGEMANEVTGKRKSSMNRTGKTSDANGNTMFEKNGQTVDQVAHSLWDDLPEHIQDNVTTQDIRNELLNVMGSHGSRFDAAKEYVENYHPDYIQAKHDQEEYDQFYAAHKAEVEAEEKWFEDQSNEQKEFEESPEYIKQLIDESSTTSPDAKTADTGSKEESSTPAGDKASDAESGSNFQRPAEDQPKPNKGEQQSDKRESVGKYESLARKAVEKLNEKAGELPSWILNTDSNINGADASTLLKFIGDATISVGKLLDKGVEIKDAIAEGTKELLDKLRELHGKLDPDYEKQVTEGFKGHAEEKFKDQQYTSIKNRIVDEEREAQGKPAIQSSGDGTMAQFEKTKSRIESGEISEEHIRDLSAALATGFDDFNTKLSVTEMHHALLYDRNTLQQKGGEIDKELTEAREKDDKKAEAMWMGKRAQNEALLENNDLAARRLGREWSDVGRARQLLIKQDYTLEALTRKYKAANKGDIPTEVKDKLRDLSKEIESKDLSIQEMQKKQAESDKEINDLKVIIEAERENRRAKMSQNDALDDLKKEVKSTVKTQGKRTIEKIKFERENIKASLKNKWKNHVKGGSMGMNNLIPLDMVPDLVKLAKSYIEEGLAIGKDVVLDKIIDRVHRDVIDALENPDIDKTSVRDAITGYGKIKKPNTDPVETAFRDLAAQGRLVSGIKLAEKGEPPLKSGNQRDKPTAEQRRLQKELNKAIKDNNIQVKSPEEQIKTSLDAAKTRLKNQIEDLTDAIDKKEKIVKDRKGITYDEEANTLKTQRDELRDEYDKIFGTKNELTNEDRLERAMKAVEKSIDKLVTRIASSDFSQNKKNQVTSPELEILKKKRDNLRKAYKEMMDAEGETNRRKLEAMKKHVTERTAYLKQIRDTDNLDKLLADRVKKKTVLDAEAIKLRAEYQKIKNDVDNMIGIREFNNMSAFGKTVHWTNRFANGVLISNPAILARILGSVVGRATFKAPTEVVKYGMSKAFGGLSKGAYTEAIRSRHDLAEHIATYYSTLFSKENFEGMKFAFKHHNTKEDLTLGRNYRKLPIPDVKVTGMKTFIQNSFFKTMEVLDRNASLHGAGKSLASLPEFRAYQKTIGANLIREGVTPEELGHATLQEAINQLAFRKSLRAKFMQDNFITGLQGSMEEFLRRKGMPNGAELVKGIAPITKISSNYISEAMTKLPVVGMVAAYKPIFKIFAKALGKDSPLSENEKSVLLRTLTYQGIGALTYALGYSLHSNFSPFYQSSASKYAQGKEDEESSWLKLFETLSHFPDALVFNAGVSHGWVWDKYDEENPGEASMTTFMGSLPDALMENARSIGSSSPYLQSANTVINPLVTGKGLGKAMANFVKARLPFSTTSNELAQGQIPVLNKFGVESGHEEKVKPYEVGLHSNTFLDNIGLGIPRWRQKILQRLYEEKYETRKPRETNQEKHDAKVRAHEKKLKVAEFREQLDE